MWENADQNNYEYRHYVDLHWALKQVKARKRSVIRSFECFSRYVLFAFLKMSL